MMLWQTRWRLMGIALIAGGAALAPTLRAPDIIIGRDAELIAIRGPDGELSAVGATRASFELERWLEHAGRAAASRKRRRRRNRAWLSRCGARYCKGHPLPLKYRGHFLTAVGGVRCCVANFK